MPKPTARQKKSGRHKTHARETTARGRRRELHHGASATAAARERRRGHPAAGRAAMRRGKRPRASARLERVPVWVGLPQHRKCFWNASDVFSAPHKFAVFFSLCFAILSLGFPPKTSRGFEPRSLDSGSRVLTVTPRGHGSESRRTHENEPLRQTVGCSKFRQIDTRAFNKISFSKLLLGQRPQVCRFHVCRGSSPTTSACPRRGTNIRVFVGTG